MFGNSDEHVCLDSAPGNMEEINAADDLKDETIKELLVEENGCRQMISMLIQIKLLNLDAC